MVRDAGTLADGRATRLDHAWTYDHLTWRNLRDGPWFGAVPTLAAAALVTSRIRLGTLVASANFRHPVPFAKELMTLDDLSHGRFTLGVGAEPEGLNQIARELGQGLNQNFFLFQLLERFSPGFSSAVKHFTAEEPRSPDDPYQKAG